MYINSTNSTNTLLREMIAAGNAPDYIYTGYQTAGRGQTGNGWESEANKNLLCSIVLPPRQNLFELNIIAAVAVHRLLGNDFTIKWPNDIYWKDMKIAGILIENAIVGTEIPYSIAGIGLNVNQTTFVSNAPNPVSLKQIYGTDFDIHELMDKLWHLVRVALSEAQEELWCYYKAHLYRAQGMWPFVEREVNTSPTMNACPEQPGVFFARIDDILPNGEIVLIDQKEQKRIYHFKQIRYVLAHKDYED